MVGTYDSLGKRPSARPQLGRPGVMEEALGGYTGLRIETYSWVFTGGITDATLNSQGEKINRVVNAQAIGTLGSFPRPLNKILVPALRTGNSSATTQRRATIPYAMCLIAQLTPAATPAGTHTVTIRVSGSNQFGEPISEDFIVTATGGGGAGTAVNGTKPFKSIAGVNVIADNNASASDTLDLFYSVASNPVMGLPVRCRDASDVVGLTWHTIGVGGADVLAGATGPIIVDVANQTINLSGIVALADAGFSTFMTIECRTSLGMDQGARSGDKLQKQW